MRFFLFAVGAFLVSTSSAVTACGIEGSRQAAAANKKIRLRSIKVKGSYHVVSKEDQFRLGEGEDSPVLTTYRGVVTTSRGKKIETSHVSTNEIILCASKYTPSVDVEGIFYLKRSKGGNYQLIDWEDKYLTEPTLSEKEQD